MIRRELREKFQKELTAAEKAFFLKTAREAVSAKRYRPSEDLFHYCYFMTMKQRMKAVSASRGDGMLRILLVEGTKDIDDALKIYIDRLEETRGPAPDPAGGRFIEYFCESG
ncbi:MAG: hypothetical protein AMK71_01085 [Nitrospira bacterium SG8_35_4]|nr:MAG: hypothetical protein AMK71_01085 [Nitrospira bacterium SG8_35_4]